MQIKPFLRWVIIVKLYILHRGNSTSRMAPAHDSAYGLGEYANDQTANFSIFFFSQPIYTLFTFSMFYINEMISLIGMQSSTLASWARSHSRMRSAHFFIAG